MKFGALSVRVGVTISITGGIATVVACNTMSESLSPVASMATAAVLPTSQTVVEGSAATWSGSVTMVQTTDGLPTYVAWDFENDGAEDQVLCDQDSATPPASCRISWCSASSIQSTATGIAAGINPRSLVGDDFNEDGKPDLVFADLGASSVAVLLGIGDGSFGPKTNFSTASGPISVAVSDFDGDGHRDLATANRNTNTLSVLLGTGTGSFGAKTDFATASGAQAVAAGDFDGDGFPDLAVANQLSNTVSVLLGAGTGSFGAKTDFATGNRPSSLAVSEFNGDGFLDLAIANNSSVTVSVLLGTGTGSFGAKTDFASGVSPVSIVAGDFNGDGNSDLAVANYSSSTVSVLLGTGTGSFGAKTDFATGGGPLEVKLGDFNGDAILDLAIATSSLNAVSLLLGDGTGMFGARTDFVTGFQLIAIAIGNLNGDAYPDLTFANNSSGAVSVRLGQPTVWNCPAGTGHVYTDSKGSGAGPSFTWQARLTAIATSAGATSFTREVIVDDASPANGGIAAASTTIAEGSYGVMTFSWCDAGTNDAETLNVAWGDGTVSDLPGQAACSSRALTHVFPNAGTWAVTSTVADDEGLVSLPASRSITVIDTPPIIVAITTNAPVQVGQDATVWVVLQSNIGDAFTFDFSLDGDSEFTGPDDILASTSNFASFTKGTSGVVTVPVRVHDDDGNVASGSIDVQWSPLVDQPPLAVDDAFEAIEDTPLTVSTAALLANDTDPDAGDVLVFGGFGQAVAGSVALVGTNLTYTPAANASGADTFTYTVRDTQGLTDTGIVIVNVVAVNDAPFAVADGRVTLESTAITFPAAELVANDVDVDGPTLAVTAVSAPVNGSVALAAGNITFTPTVGFNGAGSFTYTVSDGTLSGNGTVTVTIFPVNQTPAVPAITSPAPGSVVSSATPSVTVTNATDADGDALAYQFELDSVATFDGPDLQSSGDVVEGTTETSWTPAALSEDVIYFWRVRSSDGVLTSAWETSSFLVDASNAVPTAPIAVGPADDVRVVDPLVTVVVENASDAEGDALTYEFEIHEKTETGPLVVGSAGIAEGTGGRTSFTVDAPLSRGRTYAWVARATDANGAVGPWSVAATFAVFKKSDGGGGCNLGEAGSPMGSVAVGIAVATMAMIRRHPRKPTCSRTVS